MIEPMLAAGSSTFVVVWTVITGLIGLIWLRRHADINHAKRETSLNLAVRSSRDVAAPPALSVLVAAKDEEANIGRCIEGLLAQDYPNLQILVINDRSTDRTPELITAAAERDPRFTAVHVTEVRDGWFGKNNAMRTGVEQASGQWLAFSDADCAYDSPHLLSSAMDLAIREGIDLLSVLPRLEAETFWEKVIQPVASAILVYWHPPAKVNNASSPVAYANGAFMLMPRAAYASIGGHGAVKATLNEDIHMARRVKQQGLRLRVVQGGHLYRVRMYTRLRDIWRGWSRIFFGCFGTFPRLFATLAILALLSVSPYVALVFGALDGATGGWLCAAAAFAVSAQISVMWRFYGISGLAPGWSLAYPFGAVWVLGITVNAIIRATGAVRTTWRGTSYRGGS